MEDVIQTLHPDPQKHGVRIRRSKYDQVTQTILAVLLGHGEMGFGELGKAADACEPSDFDGSPMWYFTTAKLDLEARGAIERVPRSHPQRLRQARQA